jgi:hypothetical protein
VLVARGTEAEASLSFAGLSELLGDVLEEVGPSLAPPRRRAIEVAFLLAEPGARPPDAHAIGLALLDILRVLGERAPLVVALDDVQWLDPSSAAVLQIACGAFARSRFGCWPRRGMRRRWGWTWRAPSLGSGSLGCPRLRSALPSSVLS